MSAVEILSHLQADGLTLYADGARLLAEPSDLLTDDHRHLIRTHKLELLAILQATIDAGDEAAIRAWLAYIGEADEQIIGEVLAMCATDPAALAYFLDRATEARRAAA